MKNISNFRHDIPEDLNNLLQSNKVILDKWSSLTDLSKNEWICWLTIVKKEETRKSRLIRLEEEILNDKKRPCCWPGCPHRRESSKKWFK